MSDRPPEGMPPTPTRPVWRIRPRWLILVGAVLLILLVGFEIGIRQVSPDAVQVGIATEAQGYVYAKREITDARLVADMFARINGLPSVGYFAVYRCPLTRPGAVMYDFSFTRGGVSVEEAALVEKGCTVWNLVVGGIPSVRDDRTGRQTHIILSEAQPLPK